MRSNKRLLVPNTSILHLVPYLYRKTSNDNEVK